MNARASPLNIASRAAAGLIGGWVLVWGFVTLGVVALLAVGMSYADALILIDLLAFVVFVAAFCWSFATTSATRAWVVQLGLGSTMTVLAWWLSHTSGG